MSVFGPRNQRHRFLRDNRYPRLLDGVSLTASAATRTFTVTDCGGYSRVTFHVDYTRVSASALTFELFGSANQGESYGHIKSVSVVSGIGTMDDFIWTEPVTASTTVLIDTGIGVYDAIKLLIGSTGAAAGDLVTMWAIAGGL